MSAPSRNAPTLILNKGIVASANTILWLFFGVRRNRGYSSLYDDCMNERKIVNGELFGTWRWNGQEMDGKEKMNGICKECVWMDSN